MEQEIIKELASKLKTAVKNCLHLEKEVAVVYSGGIDSSLVAFLTHQAGVKVTAFTVGLKKSPDIKFIKSIKYKLPFRSIIKMLSLKDLKKALPQVLEILKQVQIESNLMQVSLTTALFLTFKEIQKVGLDTVLSGQGADELFAGYYKFTQVTPAKINLLCQKEFQRACQIDFQRDQAVANLFKKSLKNPYFDPDLVNLALKIPPSLKLKKTNDGLVVKYILRRLGENLGLPAEIINRPKKSFQYSTLIQREIKKLQRPYKIT